MFKSIHIEYDETASAYIVSVTKVCNECTPPHEDTFKEAASGIHQALDVAKGMVTFSKHHSEEPPPMEEPEFVKRIRSQWPASELHMGTGETKPRRRLPGEEN